MPISPLTPISLTTSVNLAILREAFKDLEIKYGFYIDSGSWCCKKCAGNEAWEAGEGKPFAFWDEQNEDFAHLSTEHVMPLCYGIANEDARRNEIKQVANLIVEVLEAHDLPCQWDGDPSSNILVKLTSHQPVLDREEDYLNDYLELDLYLPKNSITEHFCWNESGEDYGEPEDSFYFCHPIKRGESVKDALMRIDENVRCYITHYVLYLNRDETPCNVQPVLSVDSQSLHAGHCSLREALDESQ